MHRSVSGMRCCSCLGCPSVKQLSAGVININTFSVVFMQLEVEHSVSLHLRPRSIGSEAALYDVIALFSHLQARLGQRVRPSSSSSSSSRSVIGLAAPAPAAGMQGNGTHAQAPSRHARIEQHADLALAVLRSSAVAAVVSQQRPRACFHRASLVLMNMLRGMQAGMLHALLAARSMSV